MKTVIVPMTDFVYETIKSQVDRFNQQFGKNLDMVDGCCAAIAHDYQDFIIPFSKEFVKWQELVKKEKDNNSLPCVDEYQFLRWFYLNIDLGYESKVIIQSMKRQYTHSGNKLPEGY